MNVTWGPKMDWTETTRSYLSSMCRMVSKGTSCVVRLHMPDNTQKQVLSKAATGFFSV